MEHTAASLKEPLSGWDIDEVTYLMAWIANAIRNPSCRLPMLCLFGHQNAAKSTFPEALGILVPGGVEKIGKQIRDKDKFNANLEGMPFVFADEVNLASEAIYNEVKPWITDDQAAYRAMYRQQYQADNYTHWIQATNKLEFIPVFDDVSRITVLHLEAIPVEKRFKKEELKRMLAEEAPAFLYQLETMDLPPGDGRLALPIVATDMKEMARSVTDDPLNALIKRVITESCKPGGQCSLADFTERVNEISDCERYAQKKVKAALLNSDIKVRSLDGYPHLKGWSLT